MSLGIPISPKNDFLTALEKAHVEPLKGSEYTKNDTLDKYIFEPIPPIKKFTPREFKPLLSTIEEEKEEEEEEEDEEEDNFKPKYYNKQGYMIKSPEFKKAEYLRLVKKEDSEYEEGEENDYYSSDESD
jgi:hypothetical protein